MDDLIEKWLWMQAMNYALGSIKRRAKSVLYPMENELEWRFTPWEDMQKKCFEYALENWKSFGIGGAASGHSRYEVGHDIDYNNNTIEAEYKNIKVIIKKDEIQRFIEKMLNPDMEDRQMNLLELLAQEASCET